MRKLSDKEMDSWHGPTNYITVFAVVKPGSTSTKTRVVANSAMRNARLGLSVNDCMWGGPNALCDCSAVSFFWRAIEVALMVDLCKAYQSIHTSETELHLRRFVFREDPCSDWEVFGFERVTFGDLAAGLVLEVAKRRVANLGEEIDPLAAQQLKDFTYVDDSIMGGSREEVDRMRGTRKDGEYSGTVPHILARGALKVKFMAVSGWTTWWKLLLLGARHSG